MGEGSVISLRHSLPGAGSVVICCYSDRLSNALVGCGAVLGVSFVVSKYCGVFICGVMQSTVFGLLGPENQGTLIL